MKTLIKNAHLLDKNGVREGQVLIEDGKIKKIYKKDARVRAKADEVIDAQGLTLMPGFIDTHCHLRDPGLTYKEDLHTGLRAAAKGGFTTVCPMANTRPVTDTREKVEEIQRRAALEGLGDIIQVCAVTKDFSEDNLVDFEDAVQATRLFSNDGKNIDSEETMREALRASKELDFILSVHEEPETETVARDIALLREEGGHLHISHISKKDTLDLIRKAKEEGLDITCEVTPHHLYASALEYRVHPPFRTWTDRRALIEGVGDGTIDCFGTDHAPHSEEDKKNGAPGLINFETAFSMYNTVLEQNGVKKERLSDAMSAAPARRLGLNQGLLEPGKDADLVLVDFDEEWRVEPKKFESKSANTPFAGKWLKGKVKKTIKDGQIIYDDGREDIFKPKTGNMCDV